MPPAPGSIPLLLFHFFPFLGLACGSMEAVFQARIDLGGWYLERFECHLRRVQLPSSTSPFSLFWGLAVGRLDTVFRYTPTSMSLTYSVFGCQLRRDRFPSYFPLLLFNAFGIEIGAACACTASYAAMCKKNRAGMNCSCSCLRSEEDHLSLPRAPQRPPQVHEHGYASCAA